MHNLYTLRGAKVRDALSWSGYIDEALEHSADAEVFFASTTGRSGATSAIADFITKQRDVYRYMHDQTVRLDERRAHAAGDRRAARAAGVAGRTLRRARLLRHAAAQRPKAVYQYYFGWYDGNPANLDPLPPVERGATLRRG